MANIKKDSSVLLFSGGTDSYIVSQLYPPDIYLYCDIGTEESKYERETIKQLGINAIIESRLYLKDLELPNKILPMRNLFLILIACYYGDSIMVGATKGDLTRDGTEEFKDLVNELFVSLYCIPEKNPRGVHTPKVQFPVKSLTKTELVYYYLMSGFSLEKLKLTRSCYGSMDRRDCGLCISCFRKFISYVNNNIFTDTDFVSHPMENVAENYKLICRLDGENEDAKRAMKILNWKDDNIK